MDQGEISLGVKAQEATMERVTFSVPNNGGSSRHSVYSQEPRITGTERANISA